MDDDKYRQISDEELDRILAEHWLWMVDEEDGVQADLRNCNLRGDRLKESWNRFHQTGGIASKQLDRIMSKIQQHDPHLLTVVTDFVETDFGKNAVLVCAHLEGANLNRAHLEGAFLWGAHLEGAHLKGAHLERAHLEDAHLEGAHLEDAHLEGAVLLEAHLEGAFLWGAHLEEACLVGAHLDGAILTIAPPRWGEVK